VFANRPVLQTGVVEHPDVIRKLLQDLGPDRRCFAHPTVPHEDLGPPAPGVGRAPIAAFNEHVDLLESLLDPTSPVVDVGQLAVQVELVQLVCDYRIGRTRRQRPLQHRRVLRIGTVRRLAKLPSQLIDIACPHPAIQSH
jgi:hypothetical protein